MFILPVSWVGKMAKETSRSMLTLLTEETHTQTGDREQHREQDLVGRFPRKYAPLSMKGRGNSKQYRSDTLLNVLSKGTWRGISTLNTAPPPTGWINRFTQITRTPHHLCL